MGAYAIFTLARVRKGGPGLIGKLRGDAAPYDGGFPGPMFSAASGTQCLKERQRSQYRANCSKSVRSSIQSTNEAVRHVQAIAVDSGVVAYVLVLVPAL